MNNVEAAVPREMLHVYSLVERASKFSLLPDCNSPSRGEYIQACRSLVSQSEAADIHALRWFEANPSFSPEHAALKALLENRNLGGGRSTKALKTSNLEALDFLWCSHELEGVFRCAILMRFSEVPEALSRLISNCEGPHVVQGGNEAFRGVAAKARSVATAGHIALLFRPGEIEVFAPGRLLAQVFALACASCRG